MVKFFIEAEALIALLALKVAFVVGGILLFETGDYEVWRGMGIAWFATYGASNAIFLWFSWLIWSDWAKKLPRYSK